MGKGIHVIVGNVVKGRGGTTYEKTIFSLHGRDGPSRVQRGLYVLYV